MNELERLHEDAMEAVDGALAARRTGDESAAQSYFRRAFESERRAAEILLDRTDREPTRSILLRSAATLALDCHEYREAERLIAAALAGDPPPEICEELRALLERVYSIGSLRVGE